MDTKEKLFQRLARRKTGYPMASIIYYGPDNRFASKVVVGIFITEKTRDANPLLKWFSDEVDARTDPGILQEIADSLEQYHVHRVVMMDRIFGCPHEEGIDYPLGEKCPKCPYWATHDRYE
jgi:hypothetical protein